MVWATKATNAAKGVIDMINALPAAADLTGLDGAKIEAAKAAYAALPESVQSAVSNYSTLTALETSYSAKCMWKTQQKNTKIVQKTC